ncbi:hypothetical protein Landi51_00615 [Colletotrichum acutatum]
MDHLIRPKAELPRPSRDTLHDKKITKFHDNIDRADRLQINAPHLNSEKSGTRLLPQPNFQSITRSDEPRFRTERLVDCGRYTTEALPPATVFHSEAFLEFVHCGLHSTQRASRPRTTGQRAFLPEIRSCGKPGITRRYLVVQDRNLGFVPGKTGRKTSLIPFVGVPKENSAGGDIVIKRRDASSSIPIGTRRLHVSRPRNYYRDISLAFSQVADRTDFQRRALSTLSTGYQWLQAKSLETCRGLVFYLQWLLESDAQPFNWSGRWKLGSDMENMSCPSPSRQETKTGPTCNTCQYSRETSEEKPSERQSGNRSSPSHRKRGVCQHETNGQDHSDDDEVPDESRRKKSRIQSSTIDKNDNGLSLACPFYKADKRTHNRCSLLQLNRIRDVKQHLYRKHMQPHYCSRCGRQFETQTEERCHTRQQDCSKRANQPPDGITHDQQKELKERVDRKLAVKEQWFAVWAIVFPGIPPPDSPYVYSPTREVATNMRNYWQETKAEMLVDHADGMPGIAREQMISGLNTFMETFFNRFIEEHSSGAEGEQVSDSSSDGSPGTAFSSRRLPAITSPSRSQRTLFESFRDLLSVMSGAASDHVMVDDGPLIADYSVAMGETDGQWGFSSSDDAYGWDQFPASGPFFHGDPPT